MDDVNILTPKLNAIISNLNNLASAIKNNYSPSLEGGSLSIDGLLKRLTEFDDLFTEHISSKFPPVVDIQGGVRIGFHINNTPVEHAHPQGWVGSTGTCLTATVIANPNYTANWGGPAIYTNGITNIAFVSSPNGLDSIPSNQTWDGLRVWDSYPTAVIFTDANGVVTSSDFRLDEFGGTNKNSSYGYGWSVNDEMMSMFGSTYNGVFQSAWLATVTSVGSQLYPMPSDNETDPLYSFNRSPHPPAAYSLANYGDPPPGQGGIPEPPDWGEGGSHNIIRDTSDLDGEDYNTTVEDASTFHSYPNQELVLLLDDEEKVTRAKKIVRKTLNTIRSK